MDEFSLMFNVNYNDAISKDAAIFRGKKYRITVLSELLVRLEYSESGSFEDRPTELAKHRNFDVPKFEVNDDERYLTIKTSYFTLTYEKEKPMVGNKFSPDKYLRVSLNDTDKLWFFTQVEARNFKSTASSIDESLEMPKLEKGLYSTDGFVSIDDSKSLIFNIDGSVGRRSDERIDTYLFMYKKDFGYCLKNYYQLTGYPPLISRSALGIWWDKRDTYNADQLYSLMEKFKRNSIPVSILLLSNTLDQFGHLNMGLYGNFKGVVDDIHNNGIKVGVNLDLNKINVQQGESIASLPFNIYDKSFLMNYLKSSVLPLYNSGVDFMGIDFDNKDLYALRMINHYFYKYNEYITKKRGLLLSKNGLIASHLYPVNDSGETMIDWKVLKFLPLYNSTSSNIGLTWWSHAVGGFKGGVEESLLYTRYVQFSTYSPIFRFASKKGRYYKREPWSWDVKTLKIVKDYALMRHKLIPYLYSEAYKYAKTGLPIIQPLYYKYPELYDEPTYKNEYSFGPELFIAPITEKKDEIMNRTVVKIFLPTGMWYDFTTGKKYPGGKRYISFYKDENYPVFARSGAIMPLADLTGNINDTSNPSALEIHIFPGKNNTYRLYEDDGETTDYQNGKYNITEIDYNYLPNNYTVIIRSIEGTADVLPEKRKFKLKFRNTRHADEVIVYSGSNKIECKTYLDDQDFVVETEPVSTSEQLSINCKGKDIEIDAVRLINEDIDTIITDLIIPTNLKEKIAEIIFSKEEIKKKRIGIRKLERVGLDETFVKMFLKLLDYISEF